MTLLAHLISYQLIKHVERMLDPVRFPYLELPHFSLVPSVPQALIPIQLPGPQPHSLVPPILVSFQWSLLDYYSPAVRHNPPQLATSPPDL